MENLCMIGTRVFWKKKDKNGKEVGEIRGVITWWITDDKREILGYLIKADDGSLIATSLDLKGEEIFIEQ